MNLLDKESKPLGLYKQSGVTVGDNYESLITYYHTLFTPEKYSIKHVNGVIEVTRKASSVPNKASSVLNKIIQIDKTLALADQESEEQKPSDKIRLDFSDVDPEWVKAFII